MQQSNQNLFAAALEELNVQPKPEITSQKAEKTGKELGIAWDKFDIDQFWRGMIVELEHGKRNEITNVTNDDLLITGKIALAHLNEFPDYYDRLEELEKEAEDFWSKNS